MDFGLTLINQLTSAQLSAYYDADWAGYPDTRRSYHWLFNSSWNESHLLVIQKATYGI